MRGRIKGIGDLIFETGGILAFVLDTPKVN